MSIFEHNPMIAISMLIGAFAAMAGGYEIVRRDIGNSLVLFTPLLVGAIPIAWSWWSLPDAAGEIVIIFALALSALCQIAGMIGGAFDTKKDAPETEREVANRRAIADAFVLERDPVGYRSMMAERRFRERLEAD